jgi:hypothetical protein
MCTYISKRSALQAMQCSGTIGTIRLQAVDKLRKQLSVTLQHGSTGAPTCPWRYAFEQAFVTISYSVPRGHGAHSQALRSMLALYTYFWYVGSAVPAHAQHCV